MKADWHHWAACGGADPDLFNAPENQRTADTQRAEQYAIKTYCNRCPVQRECLDSAMTLRQHGVAGGLTEAERNRLRTNQQARARRARPEGHHMTDNRTEAQRFADAVTSGADAANFSNSLGDAMSRNVDPSPAQITADVETIDRAFGDRT